MSTVGAYIVQTSLTLVGIALLAWLLIGVSRRLGVSANAGPVGLVGRLALDAKRSVYLVRVGRRVLVLGGSEAGLTSLAELSDEELDSGTVPEQRTNPTQAGASVFGKLLKEKLKRDTMPKQEPGSAQPSPDRERP